MINYRRILSKIRPLPVMFLALLLVGCRVELYTSLSEQEATEMMALLLDGGIDCNKQPGKDEKWQLLVDRNDFAKAVTICKNNGLPQEQFSTMGDMFKKEGLISSPIEERVRFIYALSQELSKTISKIDGVLTARVHIVLPENEPLSKTIKPSSASVFIKSHPHSSISTEIARIKQLVINSIEGLTLEKVAVVVFPQSTVGKTEPVRLRSILGVQVRQRSTGLFFVFSAVLGVLFFSAGVFLALFISSRYHEFDSEQPKSWRDLLRIVRGKKRSRNGDDEKDVIGALGNVET
ncbi:MAG: EscJ/YscJ/HrcJ family type III secretion inner membrane ring protein [Chitinivibrionales bacterium]|nr:EscJ/YscJ/HrcJ family type III secretion inner membrane ring protein [Chitinivibrionales bacterium]MBD3356596.1 EscJ/YscJ/HrcJ family type III secretion inner membrane ring protein [Chitinivibrionales bacterium]